MNVLYERRRCRQSLRQQRPLVRRLYGKEYLYAFTGPLSLLNDVQPVVMDYSFKGNKDEARVASLAARGHGKAVKAECRICALGTQSRTHAVPFR